MIRFSATLAFQHDSVFSPFKADEFDHALDWAAASGLDGVELVISDYANLPRAGLLELKRRLDEKKLVVSTISTGGAFGREGLSLTSPDPAVRAKTVRRLHEHLDAATVLGSNVTIGLLRGVGTKTNHEQELQWLHAALCDIGAYAAERSRSIFLEAINRTEVSLLNSLSETVRFVSSLNGLSSVKVLWDVYHASIEDGAFESEIAAHVARIGHLHLADDNRAFPGFGKLNFRALFGSLAKHRFDGFVSTECFNLPAAETIKKTMPEFVRNARAWAQLEN